MNNPCYHLTGYERKIQVVFLQTKIRTLERVINTSFHCVPNARPHLERSETKYLLHALRFGFSVLGKNFVRIVTFHLEGRWRRNSK